MQSTKTKVDNFLNSHQNCEDFFNYLIKKEEDKMNDEMKKYKTEELVEKAKKFFMYDTANFKTSSSEGFKYKLELLNNDDYDCKLLEDSFDINFTSRDEKFYSSRNGMTNCKLDKKERVSKIFRVVPNEKLLIEPNSSSRSNILLLH